MLSVLFFVSIFYYIFLLRRGSTTTANEPEHGLQGNSYSTLGNNGNCLVFTLVVAVVMDCRGRAKRMTADRHRLHLLAPDLLCAHMLPFLVTRTFDGWPFAGFLCASVHVVHMASLQGGVLILSFMNVDMYLVQGCLHRSVAHPPHPYLPIRPHTCPNPHVRGQGR